MASQFWAFTNGGQPSLLVSNVNFSGKPEIALTSGAQWAPFNGSLSYLMGQRLSACTCPDDPSHPGPRKPDGSWTGRAAPEIDIIEAQASYPTPLQPVELAR